MAETFSIMPHGAFEAHFGEAHPESEIESLLPHFAVEDLFEYMLDELDCLADADGYDIDMPWGDPATAGFSEESDRAWTMVLEAADELVAIHGQVPPTHVGLCRTALRLRVALKARTPETLEEAMVDLVAETIVLVRAGVDARSDALLRRCRDLMATLAGLWSVPEMDALLAA